MAGDCPRLSRLAGTTGLHQIGVKAEGAFGPSGHGLYVVAVLVNGLPVPLALEADDIPPGW